MSLKAICQVVVYLESFKNIDLTEQGVYHLRVRIEKQSRNEPKQLVSPYNTLEIQKQLRSRKKNKIKEQNQLRDYEYKSKSFSIRYNDEEIDLEEAVVFKLELQSFPQLDTDNLFIYFDLYYSTDYSFMSELPLQFKKITELKAKLNNVNRGICNFSRLAFEEKYRSTLSVYVFSILMDYKFRVYKCYKKDKSDYEKLREKLESIQQYFQSMFYLNNKSDPEFYDQYIKQFRFDSDSAKQKLARLIHKKIVRKLPQYAVNELEKSRVEIEVDQKQFNAYINGFRMDKIDFKLYQQESHSICVENYLLFQIFLKELQADRLDRASLKSSYEQLMIERCGEFMFRSTLLQKDLANEKYGGKEKREMAKKIRKKDYYKQLEKHNIEDLNFFPAFKEQPIIFYEITPIKQPVQKKPTKYTLFVFSHGFQGSNYDMITIKNNIKEFNPKALFLIARSNEGLTEGDIGTMGQRLGQQIIEYVRDEQIEQNLTIHMIGHSLGGLILRASLKHIEKFHGNLGTFLTFSSPHLGYMNGTNRSIEAGLWFIKKWNKIQSLDQMSMTDHAKTEETFMYKLSSEGSLKHFRNVVTISSYEDSYVPWHSARIQPYKESKSSKMDIENRMIQNIIGERGLSKIERFHRIDVSFEISEKDINSMIGRTAHIKFLLDQTVLKMILYCVPDIFK